ncbi:MAG: hypothetical protein GX838_06385 [Clostridiaceae bacterium]|nr:hypothetical protein [Clostridiaceae bacterium]
MLRPQNEKYFREDEWVRLITLAITQIEYRSNIWEAIPSSQRGEISQAEFFRYVSFLAECLPGSISSYYRATDEESELMRSYAAKSEKQLTPKPGGASIWWIKARTSDLREIKFSIPVTMDEAGIPCFSKSWLQKQALLYDYVVLYLDALATGSQQALTALLRHNTEIRTETQRSAIDRRAGDLSSYYSDQVVSGKGGYRCVEMIPGRAVFEEQLLSADAGTVKTRNVVFTETDGRFRADEKIPQILNPDDTILSCNGEPLFDQAGMKAQIKSETMVELLGIPLSLEIAGAENADSRLFRVTWPGLIVEAVGTCEPSSLTFEGEVHQVFLSYSIFETGSGLRPGDSVHELYLRYPFVRENGYLVHLQEEGAVMTLAFQVESDYIARITLIFELTQAAGRDLDKP